MSYLKSRLLRRNAARLTVVGACLMLSLALAMPSASAGHGNEFIDRDNNLQSVERIRLAEAGNVACVWGKQRLDNTEVDTRWPGNLDIRCRDGNYNKPWFGLTTCTDVISNGRCNIYRLKYDWDYGRTVDGAFERRAYRYIGCHEFGHTGSLGHRRIDRDHNSCMANGHGHVFLDPHDHFAVNHAI